MVTNEFFNELSSLLENLIARSKSLLITGDVNIQLDCPTDLNSIHLSDLFKDLGLVQHVTSPTHDATSSLIDVYHEQATSFRTFKLSTLVSQTINNASIDVSILPPVYTTITSRAWRKFDVDEFK